MKDLIEIIRILIDDNAYISTFIDKNIELIKSGDIEPLEESNIAFYKFMNTYTERNSLFQNKMKEFNFSSVWDIPSSDICNEEELKALLSAFDSSIKNAHKKMALYAQLISTELNMINKIKYFKKGGKIDLKL